MTAPYLCEECESCGCGEATDFEEHDIEECGGLDWDRRFTVDGRTLCEGCYGALCESEPDDDAITTTDHRRFWQYGKCILEIGEEDDHVAALRAYMDRVKFWPDAWFISDHGNAHRIDLTKGEEA